MPRKIRDYSEEYKNQKARGKPEQERRNARARARWAYDKAGVDRAGKDIDHKTPLSKGGTNAKSNLRLVKPSTNRSFARTSTGAIKKRRSA